MLSKVDPAGFVQVSKFPLFIDWGTFLVDSSLIISRGWKEPFPCTYKRRVIISRVDIDSIFKAFTEL